MKLFFFTEPMGNIRRKVWSLWRSLSTKPTWTWKRREICVRNRH